MLERQGLGEKMKRLYKYFFDGYMLVDLKPDEVQEEDMGKPWRLGKYAISNWFFKLLFPQHWKDMHHLLEDVKRLEREKEKLNMVVTFYHKEMSKHPKR